METLTTMNFRGGRDPGCCLLILISIIVVPALIVTLHAHAKVCNADNKNLYCNGNTYQVGSVFESNLNIIFNRLVRDTYQTGFNTSVYGESPHRIYGLLQCRGDATSDQCYNCSLKATTTIRQTQSCGKAMGARIWLDLCFLRYENSSFIGALDDATGRYHVNPNNVSIDLIDFKAALQSLFANLSAKAANVPSSNRYALGTTADSFPKTYALVQCTKDISAEDCTACLSNVTDNIFKCYYGRKGVQAFFSSCIVGYETYQFFNSAVVATRSPPPVEAPSNLPVATSPTNSTDSNKLPAILGVVGGGLLLALLVVCAFTTRRRLMRGVKGHGQVEEDRLSQEQQIMRFKMKTLVDATENFHDDNKLGEGGFGPVYKGTTQDGKEIAVKKLSLKSMQGRKEFLNEVKLVAKIRHRNIVNILGCCAERSERLLVYEYLPNRSLDKVLREPTKHLDWQKRYDIIMGVARGLLYLHQDSHLRIIHRDIKASNILLDDKMNPKIADFGLARLFPEGATHVSTRVAGTYGYMAPEYALQGKLSVKADVYSFGVVVMELVTGRKGSDYDFSSETQTLLGLAWRSYQQGNMVQMIDPAIVETCNEEQALRCIHVGLLCTQADASLRPPMSTIILMLSPQYVGLPDPTKPAFVMSVSNSRPLPLPLPQPQVLSNADASITNLVPR